MIAPPAPTPLLPPSPAAPARRPRGQALIENRRPPGAAKRISKIENPPTRPAFTLIEVLVAVATLVIILGLMVSLARYVRAQSAERMTRDLLVQLDLLMAQYQARHDILPDVHPLLDPDPQARQIPLDEAALQENALRNSEQLIHALRGEIDHRLPAADTPLPETGPLRDAWGTPIVFLPRWDPAIDLGMAPRDRFFFLSAGPDRRFLTRQDNLYSYEEID